MYRVAEDSSGLADIIAAVKSYRLVALLGWQDMRQRYRRSILGPFWLTVSTAVMIGSIALVFGQILSSGVTELLPSLTAGLILWTFMSSSITEGCASFTSAEGIIKQLPIPLFVHVQRVVFRNILILAHNAIIVVLVLAFLRVSLSWATLLSLLGFLVLSINLLWISLFMGIVCTRYRDLPQVFANFLQVAFYLTPIIWTAGILPTKGQELLVFNPFFHLIEIVRAPLLGQSPSLLSWIAALSMGMAGWAVVLVLYQRYRWRIPYWL